MNYRFQKFTTTYPVFLQKFLARNPDYDSLPYEELYNKLIETRYGLSDFYTRHMEVLGNDAQDLFASVEPLQKAWARENGVHFEDNNWLRDIVLAQVKAFQPDVIYLQDLYLFDTELRQLLRNACSKPVVIIGWRFAPTQDFGQFADLDLVVTGSKGFVDEFRACSVSSEMIPLAFEHTILDEVPPPEERPLDFTFVGSVGHRKGHHSQRYALIEKLLPSTPLQIWGQVNNTRTRSLKGQVLTKTIYHTNRILADLGVSEEQRNSLPLIRRGVSWSTDPTLPSVKECYPNRFYKPVFGVENFGILARSKLVFNSHIDAAGEYAGNMRLFEATGMGACLVTDWKANLSDLFEINTEVVIYRSIDECIEKVNYLLDHNDERQAIARTGQQRTLREHTYQQRVQQLDYIIQQYLRDSC